MNNGDPVLKTALCERTHWAATGGATADRAGAGRTGADGTAAHRALTDRTGTGWAGADRAAASTGYGAAAGAGDGAAAAAGHGAGHRARRGTYKCQCGAWQKLGNTSKMRLPE